MNTANFVQGILGAATGVMIGQQWFLVFSYNSNSPAWSSNINTEWDVQYGILIGIVVFLGLLALLIPLAQHLSSLRSEIIFYKSLTTFAGVAACVVLTMGLPLLFKGPSIYSGLLCLGVLLIVGWAVISQPPQGS